MTAIVPASGSRHGLSFVPEVTNAVTPATPSFVPIRYKSTTLALAVSTLKSAEIRPDRQITGFRHGTHSASGDIVSEVTYGADFDELLSLALMGVWTSNVLKVGLLRNSVTIERVFSDVVQYVRLRGCEVTKFALKVTPGAIVEAAFSLWANDADPMAQVPITGATYAVASTTQPMNGLEGSVTEGGTVNGLISEIALSLDNGLAANYVVGSKNSLLPSVSKSDLTGTVTVYFTDAVMYNKFVSETPSKLAFVLQDLAGNSYSFVIGNVVYNAAPIPVQNDGPITVQIPFQALLDSVTGTNFQITRAPHA